MAAIEFDNVRVTYRTRHGVFPAQAGPNLSVPEGALVEQPSQHRHRPVPSA